MSRYELRTLLWSWGLMVDLVMSVGAQEGKPYQGVRVAEGAWLVIAPSATVWEGDLPHLIRGLQRVAPKFRLRLAGDGGDVVFVLDHLWYPLTDSQDDALELAIAGWAVDELGLTDEPAKVSFDRATNRYLIDFDDGLWRPEG